MGLVVVAEAVNRLVRLFADPNGDILLPPMILLPLPRGEGSREDERDSLGMGDPALDVAACLMRFRFSDAAASASYLWRSWVVMLAKSATDTKGDIPLVGDPSSGDLECGVWADDV